MKKIKDAIQILKDYWAETRRLQEQLKAKERLVERAKSQLKKHQKRNLCWYDILPYALAEELLPHVGKEQFSISGPFGISCELIIRFHNKDDIDFRNLTYCSLWLRPDLQNDENPFGLEVKSTHSTNEFRVGTIGEINGLNYPSITPPTDATIEWWIQFVVYPDKDKDAKP